MPGSRSLTMSRWGLASVAVLTGGCASAPSLPPPSQALTEPAALCRRGAATACRSPGEIEAWLRDPGLKVVDRAPTPGGTQGAQVLTLEVPSKAVVFRAKWRPQSSAGIVNDPRKELAAYAVQQLFLDPLDYVIPPSSSYCFTQRQLKPVHSAEHRAGGREIPCTLGYLSFWLTSGSDVTDSQEAGTLPSGSGLYDAALYTRNAAYRRSLGHLNLTTFLINHGDAHAQQFLLVKGKQSFSLYSVDNTIAFKSIPNPMLVFREDWSNLRVPSYPADTLRKISELSNSDISAKLRVIDEYALDNGKLARRSPGAEVGRADGALRWIGPRLQIGLTRSEIKGVTKRFKSITARWASGELTAARD